MPIVYLFRRGRNFLTRLLLTAACAHDLPPLETLNGLRDANVMCPGGGSRPHGPRERGVLEEVRAAPSALHPRRPRLAR